MNGRKANAVIDVEPTTVSHEYGQVFETPAFPHGLIATFSDGGLSVNIARKHSPEAIENYRLAKGLGMKKSAIKRLGMTVPKVVVNYQFDELGINPSSPVEVNGNQVGIGELVESYYAQLMEFQAQQKPLPVLRRDAPGALVSGAGFATFAGMMYLTTSTSAPEVLLSRIGTFYDAIAQIITPSYGLKLIVNSGLEVISIITMSYLGAVMIRKRTRGFDELKNQTFDLGETLRIALLEEGKKAGTLPLNYGVIRHLSGGGYVPAVQRR